MKRRLIIAVFLAISASTILSKFKPLPNSRLGLRCYHSNQKLTVESDTKPHSYNKFAYCNDQDGNPIARPQLFDIRNGKTILFGPGSMHESLDSGGAVRVAEVSHHGMRVSCSSGYQPHISQENHISCVLDPAHQAQHSSKKSKNPVKRN